MSMSLSATVTFLVTAFFSFAAFFLPISYQLPVAFRNDFVIGSAFFFFLLRCLDAARKKEPIFSIVNTQRPFKRAVKAAGIDDLRFHDLRHCAASYLLERGVDVRTTMQILGHKDPRMTLRVYASTTDKRMREAMDKLAIGDYDMTRTSRASTESTESIVTTENL